MDYSEWHKTILISCPDRQSWDQAQDLCKDARHFNDFCDYRNCPKRPDLLDELKGERDKLVKEIRYVESKILLLNNNTLDKSVIVW
jgi:hypothetical protein